MYVGVHIFTHWFSLCDSRTQESACMHACMHVCARVFFLCATNKRKGSVYMNASMWICIYQCIHVDLYIWMHPCVNMNASMCIYECIHAYIWMHPCVYMNASMRIYFSNVQHVCKRIPTSSCRQYARVCVHAVMCVHTCIYIYNAYACLCLCLFVCE
jgi:hypothetical protein